MMVRSSSLKAELLSLLLTVARCKALHPLVALMYRRMHRLLPDRLGENAHWTALHHPKPDYPLHILILPKQTHASLPSAPSDDPSLYADLFLLVNEIIAELNLEPKGYRLITNGGPHQTIPIWHWHLVSEAPCQGSAEPGESHARDDCHP